MTQTQDQSDEKLNGNLDEVRLTVEEAAKHVNESPDVVRNWMKELKSHLPIVQEENGYHYFDKSALERLLLIRKLNREQNYSIKQIEYYFVTEETHTKSEPMEEGSDADIQKKLDTILERLERQEQFNQVLVTKLDKQKQPIKGLLNKQNQRLLEELKNTQETTKS